MRTILMPTRFRPMISKYFNPYTCGDERPPWRAVCGFFVCGMMLPSETYRRATQNDQQIR